VLLIARLFDQASPQPIHHKTEVTSDGKMPFSNDALSLLFDVGHHLTALRGGQ